MHRLKNIGLSLLTLFSIMPFIRIKLLDSNWLYVIAIFLEIVIYTIYYFLNNNEKLDLKYKVLAIFMSFIIILGYSYMVSSTAKFFFGSLKDFLISLIKMGGLYFFIIIFIKKIIVMLEKKYHEFKNKIYLNFKSHPFIFTFSLLFIIYGLYLIIYYPGIINYDNANQIKEVLGLHTRYLDSIIPISNSTLTNFNPIVHTILIGGLVKLGIMLGNFNFGLFLYTFMQMTIVILIYSYTISYGVKQLKNANLSFIVLIILVIIPLFPFYSITGVKDTLYASFLLLFSLKLYDLVKKTNLHQYDYIELFIYSILVCLFRNNGIFIVILTIPFLIFQSKNKFLILTYVLIIGSYGVFNHVLLPNLGVSPTSIREMLSIPFQQTARLAKYHNYPFSKKDKEIINQILDYDNLARDYDEDLADYVKNKFNPHYETADIVNYFKVWAKGLVKYPVVYIDATINNISGYFNPFENSWKVYYKLNPTLPEEGFPYHYNKLVKSREFLHIYEKVVEYSPLGLILNVALITWFSILIFMILYKSKYYIVLLPNIISILFCLLSPANTYYRYIYPSLIMMLLLLPLIKNIIERKKL